MSQDYRALKVKLLDAETELKRTLGTYVPNPSTVLALTMADIQYLIDVIDNQECNYVHGLEQRA